MQTKRGRVLQFGLLYGLIASGQLTLSVSHVATYRLRYAARSDQGTYMFPRLPQGGLIPAVERYLEFRSGWQS